MIAGEDRVNDMGEEGEEIDEHEVKSNSGCDC
jgi:hypothetical protein